MRLMQFVILGKLFPRPCRIRLRKTWSDLLRFELFLQERQFYRQFVHRGDLVFDIGANVGGKTAAFLSIGARVVAVEPNPGCVTEIRRTNHRAIARGTLHVEAVAVGASRQEVTLRVFEGQSEVTSGSPEFVQYVESVFQVPSRLITVEGTTLDDLIERHGLPDFLKVDVEGMDAEVLMGLHRKPKYLSFEYHLKSPMWEHAQRCFAEAERLGFVAANITASASPKLLLDDWLEIKSAAAKIRHLVGESDRWGDVVVR